MAAIHAAGLARLAPVKPTPEKIIECECTTKALAYAVHLIQDDIAAPLDVEELARSLQMSTSHFIRTFKTQVGYSPLAYQTRLRIERAKDLLQATDLRVSEIAQRIGYQNRCISPPPSKSTPA